MRVKGAFLKGKAPDTRIQLNRIGSESHSRWTAKERCRFGRRQERIPGLPRTGHQRGESEKMDKSELEPRSTINKGLMRVGRILREPFIGRRKQAGSPYGKTSTNPRNDRNSSRVGSSSNIEGKIGEHSLVYIWGEGRNH